MSESPFVRKRMAEMKQEKAEQDLANLIDQQADRLRKELDKKVIDVLRELDYDVSDKPSHDELTRLTQQLHDDQIAIKIEHDVEPPTYDEEGTLRSRLVTRLRVEYTYDEISVDLELPKEGD